MIIHTDLQGRSDDGILQEELRKMQMSLNEERKVTEKLSRSLELEKRRSESLEQKVKGTHRHSGGGSNGSGNHVGASSALFLPDDVRGRDDLLASALDQYRKQCENMSASLEECEEKINGFEIQVAGRHLYIPFFDLDLDQVTCNLEILSHRQ